MSILSSTGIVSIHMPPSASLEKYFIIRSESWYSKMHPQWLRDQTLYQEIIDVHIDKAESETAFHAMASWDGLEPGDPTTGRFMLEFEYGFELMPHFSDDMAYADPYHLHRPNFFQQFLLARGYEDRTVRVKPEDVVTDDSVELEEIRQFFRIESEGLKDIVRPIGENDTVQMWFRRFSDAFEVVKSRSDLNRKSSAATRHALIWVSNGIDLIARELLGEEDYEDNDAPKILAGKLQMLAKVARGEVPTVGGFRPAIGESEDPNEIPF